MSFVGMTKLAAFVFTLTLDWTPLKIPSVGGVARSDGGRGATAVAAVPGWVVPHSEPP